MLALPAALAKFNGFYTWAGDFVIENPVRNLIAFGAAVLFSLAGLVYGIYRLIKRRRVSPRIS